MRAGPAFDLRTRTAVLARLVHLAAGIPRLARWYAFAALVAGGVTWLAAFAGGAAPARVLMLALLLAPGLVLLHFASLIDSVRAWPSSALRGTSLPRSPLVVLPATFWLLARPWYWIAVGISVLYGALLVPVAIVALLFAAF